MNIDSSLDLPTTFVFGDRRDERKSAREDLLVGAVGTKGQAILDHHEDLQLLADQLDRALQKMLEDHEKDFFVAYRTHMYNVQREFKLLKSKADEEETKGRREAKIRTLEAELDWFTSEALRLDTLGKKFCADLERWKAKAETLDENRIFLEDQVRLCKTRYFDLKSAAEQAQSKAFEAVRHADLPPPSVPQVKEELENAKKEETPQTKEKDQQPLPTRELSSEQEARYLNTISTLKKQITGVKKSIQTIKKSPETQVVSEAATKVTSMDNYFLKCVEEVRSEVADRRYHNTLAYHLAVSKKDAEKMKKRPLQNSDITLEMFTSGDRRRVVEYLLGQEEVIKLLYDKIDANGEKGDSLLGLLPGVPAGNDA